MTGFDTRGPVQWVDFIGKILILIGMAIFFGSIGILLSNYLCEALFQVDISQVNINNIQQQDKNIIAAMKLVQTIGGGIGMFLAPALLFPKMLKLKINAFVQYKNSPAPISLLLGLLLVFVCVPFISWLFQINQYMRFPEEWREFEISIREMENHAAALTKVLVHADNIPELLLNLFVVALVPAICEEFLFRGVLLQYTRMAFRNNWAAIIFSAIVFSGFHGQFYGFLPRFALGIVLGHLFISSGNIYVPILTHFTNNAMAVLMVYFANSFSGLSIFDDNYSFDWYWVLASLIAVVGLLWLGMNTSKKQLTIPELAYDND